MAIRVEFAYDENKKTAQGTEMRKTEGNDTSLAHGLMLGLVFSVAAWGVLAAGLFKLL